MSNIAIAGAAPAASGANSFLPLAGRALIAAIFLPSGLSKAADPAGTIGYIGSAGLPLPEVGYVIAVVVEVIGGLLLAIGYRTRLVASALAIFTLAAAFGFHFQLGDQNQFIHFFKNLAMAGGLFQVVAFGPGRFSLDGRR